MNKATAILLPASLAYGGVKLAEMLGQKGAVGALLGILGAGLGIAISSRVAGLAHVPKAVTPAASV